MTSINNLRDKSFQLFYHSLIVLFSRKEAVQNKVPIFDVFNFFLRGILEFHIVFIAPC